MAHYWSDDNIDDGTGKKESRLKIIRDEILGLYTMDNKGVGIGSSISQYGSNDWRDSLFQEILNEGIYWNRTSGTCPNGPNGSTTPCDFSESGLTEEAKTMISDAVWNLGGLSGSESANNYYITATIKDWYTYERGDSVYTNRSTEWTGAIALFHPSDYGFATGGGTTADRTACLTTPLYQWIDNDSPSSDCYTNNWLAIRLSQWTITPYANDGISNYVVRGVGSIDYDGAGITARVMRPVTYLRAEIKIVAGDGTVSNPFILSN